MKTLTKILIGIFLTASLNIVQAATLLDFDGDGRTDFLAYTYNAPVEQPNLDRWIYLNGTGTWYVNAFSG